MRALACTGCGLVVLDRPRSGEAVRRLYTKGDFSVEARGSAVPDRAKLEDSEVRALRRYLRLLDLVDVSSMRDRPAIEVGCGAGPFLALMRAEGLEVCGVELDPAYADAAEERYGIPVFRGDVSELRGKVTGVALAAGFHVFEHLESPTTTARALAELMAPGGHLYVEVPSICRPAGGDLDQFFWEPHLHYFSPRTLEAVLNQAGFQPMATGHDGDALWMVTRLVGQRATTSGDALGDDPSEVVQRLVRWRRRHRMRRITNRIRRVGARARLAHLRSTSDPTTGLALARRIGRRTPARSAIRRPLVHFGIHDAANAGDVVLFEQTRRLVERASGTREWELRPVWAPVDTRVVEELNKRYCAAVVGGGGLLLPDTNRNNVSGWQWPVATEALDQLEIPLLVVGVGYNAFRGHRFAEIFDRNIAAVVERSSFFGLRNRGSIAALSAHLDPSLHERLRFQPCPTTLLAEMNPELRVDRNPWRRRVALNLAFDRRELRFEGGEDRVLTEVAKSARALQDDGWEIVLTVHMAADAWPLAWLRRAGVRCEVRDLERAPVEEVLDFYGSVGLAVGMRGHAQLIPFGLGVPIFSLVSHQKMWWFLDDIRHREWGAEVSEPDLSSAIEETAATVASDPAGRMDAVRAAREELWAITAANLEEMTALLSESAPSVP